MQTALRRCLTGCAPLVPFLVGALSATRLLFEALFPHWAWLGQPLPAVGFALAASLAALGAWHGFTRGRKQPDMALALLLLLLNLFWLFAPDVDLVRSRLLAVASLWLTIAFLLDARRRLDRPGAESTAITRPAALALLWLALVPVYLLTMGRTVGQADTFEFQVIAPRLGIAHPTGYPLYLLLGKAWTSLIPFGSVAWRLNLGTAVYALFTVSVLFLFASRLTGATLYPLLGALVLGLVPTFWSQAVEAEVYTLHALIVCAVLWLMYEIVSVPAGSEGRSPRAGGWRLPLLLLMIGLGLANHLTTAVLLVPLLVLLVLVWLRDRPSLRAVVRSLPVQCLSLALPLCLYAYLPLRWAAVNGEPMGTARFVDWVIAGRFRGAWQWGAWLHDPIRYSIVGRLFLDNWGVANLVLAGIGLVYLSVRQWRIALLLGVTWLGFTFYALNYYVPDLAVFLMGAHVVIAVWWVVGAAAAARWAARIARRPSLTFLVLGLLLIPALMLAVQTWPRVDRSGRGELARWGAAALHLPLATDAAILADSEKVAPLYYLQQVEGLRPDLTIMVLPDEAAYRAELNKRLAAGQTVYLARFVPGLAGIYHLRAVGPLTEVSEYPLTRLPDTATPAALDFGGIRLSGYEAALQSPFAPREAAVTLYWQATGPQAQPLHVYLRWSGEAPLAIAGQQPVNGYSPTNAWDVGEIVPDFHRLPHPISPEEQVRELQVAVAPPFTAPADLAWQTVTRLPLPATGRLELGQTLRASAGPAFLTGVQIPFQARPASPVSIVVSGYGYPTDGLQLRLSGSTPWSSQGITAVPGDGASAEGFSYATELTTGSANGSYSLVIVAPGSRCGWLRAGASDCVLGTTEVSGAPLPRGAVNFDDKMALLGAAVDDQQPVPGGQLRLNLTWQGLSSMSIDYTVFVQVLDARDRIVGQSDAWPMQGTRPTSGWKPGEVIADPYVIRLSGDMPSGEYRVIVGLYRLSDLSRLPVLDAKGTAIDDKAQVFRFSVP